MVIVAVLAVVATSVAGNSPSDVWALIEAVVEMLLFGISREKNATSPPTSVCST